MHCYELSCGVTQGGLHKLDGLRIEAEAEGPRVNITGDGEFYLSLSPRVTRFLVEKVPPVAPVRIFRAQFAEVDLDFEERRDCGALVCLRLEAPPKGSFRLTSCAYGEFIQDRGSRRLGKQFDPFPSMGIRLLHTGEHDQVNPPWGTGAPKIEVAMVLDQGAGFRVQRLHPSGGLESFVRWDGSQMRISGASPRSRFSEPVSLGM